MQDTERLNWIDAARGLAIFGIFMVNVPAFNAPYFLYGGEEQFWPSDTSQIVQTIIDIFFQASFYTLFSLMFGFGLYMMKNRLEQKHINYRPVIFRRLLILLGFGAVHAFLIWHGDILLSYGLFGFAMFAFFNGTPKTLLVSALSMLGLLILPLTLGMYAVRSKLGMFNSYEEVESARQNYGEGSLLNIWQQNFADWTYSNNFATLPMLALSLIPMFLIGAYIAKKRWLHDPDAHLPVIKKWWVVTGLLFILFKAGPYVIGNPEWFQLLQDNIGGSASAVFYLLSVTLAYRSSGGGKLLQPLSWVGRMSLSNYILQSIICFILFYSVGFGWYGEVPPLASAGIVILVFSLQVFLSKWWIHTYRYGPLEWLWRTLTYGKVQPFKRTDSQAS
nr:DUF418 domain-containing protein [Halobacillus sp. A5]